MSFKISLSSKERGGSRFLAQVHAVLANAAMAAKKQRGLTQRDIAEKLAVDKSVISRILSGAGNPTARTIGEISAVLGFRPELVMHPINQDGGNNKSRIIQGVHTTSGTVVGTSTTAGSATTVTATTPQRSGISITARS